MLDIPYDLIRGQGQAHMTFRVLKIFHFMGCVFFIFYARKQLLLLASLSHRNSVRPSVRPSHGWISQKRCKLGSPNLHRWLPGRP